MPNEQPQHRDMDVFRCPGGLFDVEPCAMDLNIGRRGRFLNPEANPSFGMVHREPFTVIGVQKNYKGDKIYRVCSDSDTDRFGMCAKPGDIEFTDS